MQTPYLWNKLHLRWTQAAVVAFAATLFSMAISPAVQAQKKNKFSTKSRTVNHPDYYKSWMKWGIQLGVFQSGMKLAYSDRRTDTVMVTQRPSFSLGFNLDFATSDEHIRLRFVPNFAFFERNIQFRPKAVDAIREDQVYESVMVELPVLLKYRSTRRHNQNMYMVAGLAPSIEVGGKSSLDTEGLSFRKTNLELNYGVGFDFFWTFFKFSPELRFSHGLLNILGDADNVYNRQLDRISTHKVTLYLNFE